MEKQNTLFYDKIQSQFSQEAGSFIPDPVLEQTLSAEKNLFEKADFLGISAQKIIYGNSLRHCKYMLCSVSVAELFYGAYVSFTVLGNTPKYSPLFFKRKRLDKLHKTPALFVQSCYHCRTAFIFLSSYCNSTQTHTENRTPCGKCRYRRIHPDRISKKMVLVSIVPSSFSRRPMHIRRLHTGFSDTC